MTAPVTQTTTDGMLAQILLEQGKQGTRLAVIDEKVGALRDHEDRLRALERFRFTLMGAVVVISGMFSAGATWIGVVVTRR